MAAESCQPVPPDVTVEASALFRGDRKNILARNAATRVDVMEVLLNRDYTPNHVYSNKIPLEGRATSQKSSGRCWMFAALNMIRLSMMREHRLENTFELSQSHLFFWDKYERANWFLETIIDTAYETRDTSDRLLSFLLEKPVNDGGQWEMFVNLVNKYGLVPQSAAPESYSSSNSMRTNQFVTSKLREYASRLRDIASRTVGDRVAGTETMRTEERGMLAEIYRILSIMFGEPVKQFDWSIYNKEKQHIFVAGTTPLEFAQKWVPFQINDYVSLINDPRNEYNRLYTVAHLGNIVGGLDVAYVNLPISELNKYARKTIEAGNPVWFGCDSGKNQHRKLGVFDPAVYDYPLLYGTGHGMDKATRVHYGESSMTHAMLFVGFDARANSDPSAPPNPVLKWRVENSWGEEAGEKGYFLLSDRWFDEYLFQVVINKSLLSPEILAIIEQEPVVLPAWDPMGTLAEDLNSEDAPVV